MKYLISMLIVLAFFASIVQSTYTGIAISMNSDVLKSSKSASVEYLTSTLSELKFDDISLSEKETVTNLKIANIMIDENKVKVDFIDNKLVLEVSDMQCVINGKLRKSRKVLNHKDQFEVAANFQPGAISIHMEFLMDK